MACVVQPDKVTFMLDLTLITNKFDTSDITRLIYSTAALTTIDKLYFHMWGRKLWKKAK